MSYSEVTGHHSMVFDSVRNAAYDKALAAAIGPDTIVMDLGAGLGVHGLSAAKLGAAVVHLVEPTPVVEVARLVAEANCLSNAHCHQCRVEDLELDSPVDVIVSAFTGNFLLTEDLLPSLFNARDRFLAPGGRMIPDRGRMEVAPVTAAAYYEKNVDGWKGFPAHAARYDAPDLDYSSVRKYAANTLYYDSRKNIDPTPLAPPAILMELDFTDATSAACDSEVTLTVEHSGTIHGWMGWFQMRLGQDWLSTSGEPSTTHWSPVFLPLEQPLKVTAGQELGFALKRPEFGEWTWTTRLRNERQRQSTFLSQPISVEQVRQLSDNHHPVISPRGAAMQWLLPKMTGTRSVSQLAIEVRTEFPSLYPSSSNALQFVREVCRLFD